MTLTPALRNLVQSPSLLLDNGHDRVDRMALRLGLPEPSWTDLAGAALPAGFSSAGCARLAEVQQGEASSLSSMSSFRASSTVSDYMRI